MKNLIILISLFLFASLLKAQTTTSEFHHPNGKKVVLINFNKAVSSEFVLAEIKSLNLKPATFEDMQSFLFMQYDKSLMDATIAAIGSTWSTVVARTLIPYRNKDEKLNFHWIEDEWSKDVLFMTFASAQTPNRPNPQMTFQEVDSLWKITPFLENEAPPASHFMTYSGGTDKLSGRVRYFVNETDKYEVIMCVSEMPRAMESQQVSMQLLVNGKSIPIPKEVSYQEYDHPKLINGKIIIRPHVGIHPEGDYFYVIIDGEVLDHWKPTYYCTKRFAQVEYQKGQ
jgi:hypothetical protein